MNLAIIKHDNDYRKFLFSVPDHVYLKKGDRVICKTRFGESDGTCVYDSFALDGPALDIFVAEKGAHMPLAPIIGEYQKVMFEDAPKISNGDRIRALDDEALLAFLKSIVASTWMCKAMEEKSDA